MQYNEGVFHWPDGTKSVFPVDDRLDPELFRLAAQSWKFLDNTLNGLRLNEQSEEWGSRILMLYYAARIHGASGGATMSIAHGLGREAIILSRCQFEYFVKMLYYDHHHDEATKAIQLLRYYGLRFSEAVGFEVRKNLPQEAIAKLDELSKGAYRGNFRTLVDSLKADSALQRSAEEGNPFAIGFLKNAESMYRTHWTYGSTITHAGIEDIDNVLVRGPDANWNITLDSRMKAPNKTVLDVTQRCFSATGLLRWRFNLGFDPEHIEWAARFGAAGARHADEPTDIRSMHD